MKHGCLTAVLAAYFAVTAHAVEAAHWEELLNGRDLTGWEVKGLGVWSVIDGGVLVGQCDPDKPCLPQSWLYTEREFDGDYDVSLEYWLRLGGNSGVSIGDTLRAKNAVDPKIGWPTPARSAYEVNIDNGSEVDYDITGSIYKFAKARAGVRNRTGWNTLLIEVRKDLIRVSLNGVVVAQHPGVPERPKHGPIGLQLHSPTDVVMFRNIRVRSL
ncbi:MAG TPA: DUF1080 domain-containing protein [Bryobacteraceae bacterium]|nr:DUF1080 domain-containing protein [Bryobacteraceae bacterium]